MTKIKGLEFNIISAAGQGNLGDDAMLFVLVSHLSQYGSIHFVSSDKLVQKYIEKKFEISTRAHPGDKERSVVVIGGGTLFDKGVHPPDPYLKTADNLLNLDYRIYFTGIGVISFFDESLAKRVFLASDGVTVRNQESAEIITKLTAGVRTPEIIGDLAESYPFPKKTLSKINTVGIDLSPKELIPDHLIGQLLGEVDKQGLKTEWFSFSNHRWADHENDLLLGKRIQNNEFSDLNINDEDNLDSLLRQMTKYKLIVTSRLHVLLFAKRLGIPVVNVSQAEKNLRYCNQFNLQTLEINQLISKVNQKELTIL